MLKGLEAGFLLVISVCMVEPNECVGDDAGHIPPAAMCYRNDQAVAVSTGNQGWS
jgi:hypothetical protein